MNEYPDPEDEYDLLYQEEMELMREMEQEAEAQSVDSYYYKPTSRNSLKFDEPSSNKENQNLTTETNVNNSSASSNNVNNSEPETVNVTDSSQKNNFTKRFLSTDSLLDMDSDLLLIEPPPKRHKNNDGIVTSKPNSDENHNQFGVTSLRIPKWPFMPVSADIGERLYVRMRADHYIEDNMSKYLAEKNSFGNLLGESYHVVKKKADKLLLDIKKRGERSQAASSDCEVLEGFESSDLWVEKYKPKKYLELLSDEGVNRTLLNWVKMWDKVVFNREFKGKPKTEDKNQKQTNTKFQTAKIDTELDSDSRPQQKIALLCGPPGLGKTTLAHVIAVIAGYNVIEVNASDDRSPEVFHTKLEAATKMQSVNGRSKPNCLILDEIDGAPSSSIDYLLKYINGKVNEKSKKGKKDKPRGVVKRPVICICNEPYVPSLRLLRQQAYVVHFPHTSSSKLAQRLLEICRKQNIKTDLSTLTLLCEKTQSDIRSCISTLHFFKSKNGQTFKVSDVAKSNVGQKDLQKGLFSLWQEIFQVPLKKDNKFSVSVLNNAKEEHAMLQFHYSPKNMERLKNIVEMIQSAGDYEKLLQGIHENFLKMRFPRSRESIASGLDWFCWNDILDTSIRSDQNFILMGYLPYSFAAWHFLFSSTSFTKISYPNQNYENHLKSTRCKQILNDVLSGLNPIVRIHAHSQQLLLDVLPMFDVILEPSLRPVNTKLFNEKEKKEFNHLLSVMIDYNLNYIQQRGPDGNYFYQFDPNIDELVRFDLSEKSKSSFSYNMKQLISREVELEKVRRTEATRADVSESVSKKLEAIQTPERKAPNHLQKLTPKQVKIDENESSQYKDFFGRIVKVKKTADSADGSSEKNTLIKSPIWFCFKEGYNNAVKKDVTIANVL